MTDALPFPSSDDEADGAAIPPRPAETSPVEKKAPAVPAAPYVGPRAFRPGETLYGRDREARELMDVLVAERIVLCHSPSGAGKTSLIQALLVPRLEKAGFAVYGPARVGSALGEGTPAGANRYVLSALLGMEKERDERLRAKIERGEAPASAQTEPIPIDRLAAMTVTEYLEVRSADDDGRDPVLVFDQFEEILTLDPNDVEAKTEFFRQVGTGLRPRHRWALFAMREEYVAALDPYLHLVPTGLTCRYPLKLLDASGARAAIAMPARDRKRPFTDEALDKLVDNLLRAPQPGSPEGVRGRWVEPVQLQVVCTRLWQKLPPETTEIGTELVGGVEDVDTALADYYAETVAAVAREKGVRERDVRRWFEKALISGDVRTQVARGGERAYGLGEPVVDALVNAYLVRREERRGSIWYELAHDRLMAPVRGQNTHWFRENASFAQRRAALWALEGRGRKGLLRGREIKEAEAWLAENPEEYAVEVEKLIAVSRRMRVRRRWAGGIAIVAGLVILVVSLTQLQQSRARARAEEVRQLAAAQVVTQTAVSNALAADSALRTAETQGDSVQPDVAVTYFFKRPDPGVEGLLREAGFNPQRRNALNQVPTNYMAYGDSVRAGTLRRLAYTLLRAGVQLKGICPFSEQRGRQKGIELVGVTGLESAPLVTTDQVAAISDTRRRVNCAPPPVADPRPATGGQATGPPTIVLQYRDTGDVQDSRLRITGLMSRLQRAGYFVTEPERRNESLYEVRYFNDADRGMADSVAALTAFILRQTEPPRVRRFRASVPAGRVELWVDLVALRSRQRVIDGGVEYTVPE